MLNEAKLPNIYWREAIYTIVYILNISQLRVNHDKTPYELWFGRPTKNHKVKKKIKEEASPRKESREPSIRVQRDNPERKIRGKKSDGFEKRRRLTHESEQALLFLIEYICRSKQR
jgi:hypothetical protein